MNNMETTISLSNNKNSRYKAIITGLIIAALGIALQIISGVPYPKVPPVFFTLLVPLVLVIFIRSWWTSALVIVAGLFLIAGLFASGSSSRLLDFSNAGGSIGLWIQMIGVVIATIAAIRTLGTKKYN